MAVSGTLYGVTTNILNINPITPTMRTALKNSAVRESLRLARFFFFFGFSIIYGSINLRIFHYCYRQAHRKIDSPGRLKYQLMRIPWLVDYSGCGHYHAAMEAQLFGNLKLAFFDIDGTLMHRHFDGTLSLKSRAFNYATERVFGLRGFDYTKILGKRIFGLTDRSIIKVTLQQIGIDEGEYYHHENQLFKTIDEYFEKNIELEKNSGYRPNPGVEEFLRLLANSGIRLGLVTGNIKKHADWKMQICGFDGLFTTGGFGEDAEHRPEIMQIGIDRNSEIPIDQICHFGDSPPDLMAARECGIRAVANTASGGGTHTRFELEEVGYGLVIDSWKEVRAIVEYLA
jgi:phosphoglycolate phosphatase-like HAD superfamily hydrolase